MKVVRDHRAKWLPSRHRYALSKLIAFVMFRAARHPANLETSGDAETPQTSAAGGAAPASPGMVDHYVFSIDPNQSSLEAFTVAALVFVTTAVDLAVLLPLRPWIAVPVAILATPWLLQIPLYVAGLLFHNERVTSIVILTLVAAASGFVASMPTPARFVAWLYLAVLTLNALAWFVAQPLRKRMDALEQECAV